MSCRCSIGLFWGRWGPVNGINALVIQDLPAHSGHMRPGIVLHQEEPRAHCTCIRSDNCSEDFIPVPNSSQGNIMTWRSVRPSKDTLSQTITDHRQIMLDDVTGSITFISRLFHVCHMCSAWTCSYLWREQCASGGPVNSDVLWQTSSKLHSAGLWAQVTLTQSWPSCQSHEVCLWQFEPKHAQQ